MDEDCVETWLSYTKMVKKHMLRSIGTDRANEYQFMCTRCFKFCTIKKRIFWGLTPVQYLYAVVLRGKYQR